MGAVIPATAVPPAWEADPVWGHHPGVVIIGGGPSLSVAQLRMVRLARIRKGWRVIVINEAWTLMPDADLLYACDGKWWLGEQGGTGPLALKHFAGAKVKLGEEAVDRLPGVYWMQETGTHGFDERPWCLKTGRNSGYQALHLSVHLGAQCVALIGFDMKIADAGDDHWHKAYRQKDTQIIYDNGMLPHWPSIVPALEKRGIAVVNCTPGSKLKTFPCGHLGDLVGL